MIRTIYISAISIFCLSLNPAKTIKVITPASDFKQSAVIELFSSEGCSSCPPADALLNKIKAENNPGVYTLAFHVDYWDYIGWKDKLALPVSTERQYAYCKQLQSNPYTPQAVVNGSAQMVGSSEREIRAAIKDALSAAPAYTINASAITDNNKTDISYTVSSNAVSKDYDLQIALVEDNIITSVKRGENTGKTLTHNSVVRSFSTEKIMTSIGKRSITIPAGINTANLRLVLFIQNNHNLHILSASGAKLGI